MAKTTAERIPHSWPIPSWPTSVYPCSESRGRYIVRMHREELKKAGALVRVGRDLVIFGAEYSAWLQKQAARVDGFEIAPNRARNEQQVV
jgi:hypothetical protein